MSSCSNLTKQSVSAVKWSAFGNLARYGLQLGAQIVLAHLLGSENYGLFALGMMVLNFSNMLANFGLAWGLVQVQELTNEDVRFVFTWQLISGTITGIGLYFLSPVVASFFNEIRLESIIKWLSLACILSAATATASNLLRRRLDFKAINIIEVISYIIGYIVIGVPLAFNGAGVWSLVAAWLSQTFCALILYFIRSPHSLKPLFWYEGAMKITGVGYTVFITNICNWLLANLDCTLLGRFLNAQSVGLYSLGYNLANTPNSFLVGALQPAFLAVGARIQTETDRLRGAYLSVLASIWILILPMFVILAIIAKDLVAVLYGSAWDSSGLVLTILALSMPAYITFGLSTPVLWNTGRNYWESLLQFPILAASGFAYFNLASQGVVMVAIVAALTLLARAIVITSAACHQLKISPRDLLSIAIRAIGMASVAAVGAFAGLDVGRIVAISISQLFVVNGIVVNHILVSHHFYALLLGISIGSSLLMVTSFVYPKILGAQVINMLGRFNQSLFVIFNRRLQSTSLHSYALLACVLSGSCILITPPLIYPRILEVRVLQMLEYFNQPVNVSLNNKVGSTSNKEQVGR
jgi:PST family polysaccharide transporter